MNKITGFLTARQWEAEQKLATQTGITDTPALQAILKVQKSFTTRVKAFEQLKTNQGIRSLEQFQKLEELGIIKMPKADLLTVFLNVGRSDIFLPEKLINKERAIQQQLIMDGFEEVNLQTKG